MDAAKGDTCEGDPKVTGCLIEEAAGVCKICDSLSGYEMLTVAGTTKCYKCDYTTSYISADGICQARLNSASNCKDINRLKD